MSITYTVTTNLATAPWKIYGAIDQQQLIAGDDHTFSGYGPSSNQNSRWIWETDNDGNSGLVASPGQSGGCGVTLSGDLTWQVSRYKVKNVTSITSPTYVLLQGCNIHVSAATDEDWVTIDERTVAFTGAGEEQTYTLKEDSAPYSSFRAMFDDTGGFVTIDRVSLFDHIVSGTGSNSFSGVTGTSKIVWEDVTNYYSPADLLSASTGQSVEFSGDYSAITIVNAVYSDLQAYFSGNCFFGDARPAVAQPHMNYMVSRNDYDDGVNYIGSNKRLYTLTIMVHENIKEDATWPLDIVSYNVEKLVATGETLQTLAKELRLTSTRYDIEDAENNHGMVELTYEIYL